MMGKILQRLWRLFVRFWPGTLSVFGIVTGLTLFNHYLPVYLETDLFPSFARQAGISTFSCDVRSIGLNHTDISDLRMGSDTKNAVQIDSVRLDYSVKGLYNRHIKRLIVSNPEFHLHCQDGQWRIDGLNRETETDKIQVPRPPQTDSGMRTAESEHLPVTIGKISVRNAVLVARWQGQTLRLPFDIEITPQNNSLSLRRIDSIIRFYPAGQKLVCKAAIDFVRKRLALSVDADDFQLARLKDYLPLPDDLVLRSRMALHANASSAIMPFNLTDIQADLYLHDFKVGYQQMVLENLYSEETDSKKEQTSGRRPVHIRLMGKNTQKLAFAVMNVAVSKPVHTNIQDLSGIIETQKEQIHATGNYALVALQSDRSASGFGLKPLEIKGHYQANVKPDGAWDMLASASARKAQLSFNSLTFTSASQQIEITGQGVKNGGNIRFGARISDWHAFHAKATDPAFNGKAIALKGEMNFDSSTANVPQIAFSLETPVNGSANRNIRFKIPTFVTTGKAGINTQGQISFNGQIQLKDTWVKDSETDMAIKGIDVKLPLQWPCARTGAKGSLTIKKLQWQNKHLGSLKAALNQTKQGGDFAGNYFSTIAPNLTATFSGQLTLSSLTDYRAEMGLRVSRYQTGAAIDIARILPQAQGFSFNGEFNLNGGLTILPGAVRGTLQSAINAARIELKDTGLVLEGVDVRVNMPDLPDIRSAPGQLFSFKKAQLGNLKFNNGKIRFQIESSQSFLIETGEFEWCGGHVDTPAIRIKAGVKDYSGVLYCDRLNFSMLLNQLGDVSADGQGTVNGRLPMRFADNKISFQDGFLYSTPGQGGTIQIISTSLDQVGKLTDGSGQSTQIELAREALKDYIYKWVKLNLTTQGELIKARLQMDGKPANPLPFIYDKKLGAFTRAELGAGSRFQGIRLDVNFSLPLNKILHYGTQLQ